MLVIILTIIIIILLFYIIVSNIAPSKINYDVSMVHPASL